MTTTATPSISTAPYARSTGGKAPRGFGTWAFQASTSHVAFNADLVGEPTFINANYGEAKAIALRHFAGIAPVVAVLG